MTAAANATAILIVEDEWLIRSTAADALGDAGFAVHEAQHAAEAISILEARHNDIHVIFTDVTMPGDMDGVGLAHHAAQHWPRIAADRRKRQTPSPATAFAPTAPGSCTSPT